MRGRDNDGALGTLDLDDFAALVKRRFRQRIDVFRPLRRLRPATHARELVVVIRFATFRVFVSSPRRQAVFATRRTQDTVVRAHVPRHTATAIGMGRGRPTLHHRSVRSSFGFRERTTAAALGVLSLLLLLLLGNVVVVVRGGERCILLRQDHGGSSSCLRTRHPEGLAQSPTVAVRASIGGFVNFNVVHRFNVRSIFRPHRLVAAFAVKVLLPIRVLVCHPIVGTLARRGGRDSRSSLLLLRGRRGR